MKKRIIAGGALAAALAVAALAVTVGAVARSGATPLPASSCSAIQNGSGKVLVASDLPLQGAGCGLAFQCLAQGPEAGVLAVDLAGVDAGLDEHRRLAAGARFLRRFGSVRAFAPRTVRSPRDW